jgi:hypothetical protein
LSYVLTILHIGQVWLKQISVDVIKSIAIKLLSLFFIENVSA